jgi:NAD+ diphosphatase
MTRSRLPYTFAALDRSADKRKNPAWLAARLADPTSRFTAVWRGRNLVEAAQGVPIPRFLAGERASLALEIAEEIVFLGLLDGCAIFALDLSPLEMAEAQDAVGEGGTFRDLREVGPEIAQADGALLAYARAIVFWHGRHRFCGACGAPTESKDGGHARICSRDVCGLTHFPRTDPAVIMLVHDGGDWCVLAHNKRMPPGMHSTLAGFVEPGESVEEAVAREVREEVGLEVAPHAPRYFATQPWPFPASLMVGFHVRAPGAALSVDPEELAHARWFHRDELRFSPEDESFALPRADSIARRLIDAWLTGGVS